LFAELIERSHIAFTHGFLLFVEGSLGPNA
jgi:hypothetical protein